MKYYYLIFIFICISCSSNNQESSLDQLKQLNNIKIYGSVLENDSIIWGENLIDIVNNKLIIQNFKTNFAFTTFTINGNKLVKDKDLIQKGNGPYEMIYPSCFVDKIFNNIYFYDINGANITIYKTNTIPSDNIYNTKNWSKQIISSPNNYFWSMNETLSTMGDSVYVLLGGSLFKENMFTILQIAENNFIDTDISFPSDNCDAEAIIKRQIYNNGGIRKRPYSDKYLYYCSEGNYAEIISFENINKVTRKVIINDLPTYTTAENGINPKGDENNLRGLKTYTTDQYIYIMPYPLRHKDFIGKVDYKGYPTYYNNDIYVFSWDGNFIKSYTLDKLINTFVVSDDNAYILGITTEKDDDYRIYKFAL